MKYIILSALLLGIIGCSTSKLTAPMTIQTNPDSELIESTILWKAECDEVTWQPIELSKLLEDESRFKAVGNFYEVLDETEAFGSRVSYIGLLGIELAMGPNAVIQSKPEAIAKYISHKYGIVFTPEAKAFVSELGENLQLVIVPHPNIKGSSMIIGEYTGL